MTLGGTLFIYNGKSQDYCYMEAIKCLKDLCDVVVVVDAGSTDSTQDDLATINGGNCGVTYLDGKEWSEQKGKEKLNYFSNVALDILTGCAHIDYFCNLQGDEIIHEDSFPFIRQAMETGAEGFLTRRHNLWRDPYHQLNVVQSRKPCSTEIIRLAKPTHRSVGDAESLECQPFNLEFLDKIEIYHMGFVRNPFIMKKKIIHMQEEVFQMGQHDKKLDLAENFQPMDYFNEDDLIQIKKPLPKYVQKWAADRYESSHVYPPTFK